MRFRQKPKKPNARFLRLHMEQLESRELLAFDFGDAPDSSVPSATPHGYPTMLVDDGARHEATGPMLGTTRDTEADGQPDAFATSDDSNGLDLGSGGVSFSGAVFVGQEATLVVNLQNPVPVSNKLDAWIDFNRDGDWNDNGEKLLTDFLLGTTSGNKTIQLPIPATAQTGYTFSRFRLSTAGNLAPTGAAADGEVEDYRLSIQTNQELARWNFDQASTTRTCPRN